MAFIYFEFYYLIRPSRLGKEILDKYNFDYPVLIAHRGSSYAAPESTEAAMRKSVQSGIDYIEMDVQRTKDGELVIFHDQELLRLTDAAEVFPERDNYRFRNFTLEELRKLDYGSWFNETYPDRAREEYEGLGILTLREVIEIVDPINTGVGLALELKSPYLYQGIEKEVTDLLAEKEIYEEEDQAPNVLFLSFSPASLERLGQLRPESPRLLLTSSNVATKRRWDGWLNLTEEVAEGIGPKGHVSMPWYIGSAHKSGLFVFPYVINRSWQIKVLTWFSADGYITDRPELLNNFFDRARELSERTEEFGDEMFSD